jgi:hypothetical protein
MKLSGDGMSEYKLTENIIALSNSDIWDVAKLEWRLKEVYEAGKPETCLCGHFPIIEVCVLENTHNHEHVNVGNSCVKKFIGLPSDKIFQSVKKVQKDNEKALNAEALRHAYEKGWINDWEFNFGIDTMRKRKLSENQLRKRIQINKKMMQNMRRISSNT